MEVWLNGQKKVELTTTFGGTDAEYLWKFGIYGKRPLANRPFICYYDNIRIATGNNQYAMVDPQPITTTINFNSMQHSEFIGERHSGPKKSGYLLVNGKTFHATETQHRVPWGLYIRTDGCFILPNQSNGSKALR